MSQLLSKKYPDAYEEFFTSPLRILVCPVEVFLEFFDMEIRPFWKWAAKNMPQENASMEVKKQHFDNMLEQFVNYHVFHLGVTVDDQV